MSERTTTSPSAHIDVDAAFDSEKRQAQAEYNDYLAGRIYEDDNGRIHEPEMNKFIKNPNEESQDGYYNRLIEESSSVEDERFAGKSLKDLATMVRDARLSGDKTLENDARSVFDDKFIATAEKYGWEGKRENSDGSVDDRNDIADRKLAYYESIMDAQGSDTTDSEAADTATASTEATAATATDAEEPLEIDTSWKDEKDPGEDAALENEAEQENATEKTDTDEPLELDTSWKDQKDPGEDAALERDDEQAEAKTSDTKEPLDLDTSWKDEKDPGEDAALERNDEDDATEEEYVVTVDTRNKLNKANAELRNFVKNPTQYLRQRLAELRGTPETRDRRTRRARRILGVSAIAGMFIAPAFVMSADSGQTAASLGARGTIVQPGDRAEAIEHARQMRAGQHDSAPQVKPTDIPKVYSPEARVAQSGEGWYQTFDEMGIDSDKQAEVLAEAGPQLKKMNLAYFDRTHNEWRISHKGTLPQEALDLIADTAKNL
ncbi:MAG TPA: hypothetical protein VL362_01050 [Patescibacteria group bacterium]|nr:hypothetical protein [Patescibacteria group bacterium]